MAQTSPLSARARLASLLIGRPVAEWIEEARNQGATWSGIAEELATATGGEVRITRQAVQQWAQRSRSDAAA